MQKNKIICHLVGWVLLTGAAQASPLSPFLGKSTVLYQNPNYAGYSVRVDTDGTAYGGYVCPLNSAASLIAVELLSGGVAVAGEIASRVIGVGGCPSPATGFYIPIPESASNPQKTIALRITDAVAKRTETLQLANGTAILSIPATRIPMLSTRVPVNTVAPQGNLLDGTYCINLAIPNLRVSGVDVPPLYATLGANLAKSTRCPNREAHFSFTASMVSSWLRVGGALSADTVWLWASAPNGGSSAAVQPVFTASLLPPVRPVKWVDIFDDASQVSRSPFKSEYEVLSAPASSLTAAGAAQGMAATLARNSGRTSVAVLTRGGWFWDTKKRLIPTAELNFKKFVAGWTSTKALAPDIGYIADEPYWTGTGVVSDPAAETEDIINAAAYIKASFPQVKLAISVLPGFYLLPQLAPYLNRITAAMDYILLDPYPTFASEAPPDIWLNPIRNAAAMGCVAPLLARREEVMFACAAQRIHAVNPRAKLVYAFQSFLALDGVPSSLQPVLERDLMVARRSAARSAYDTAIAPTLAAVAPFGYFWGAASYKEEHLTPSTGLTSIPPLQRF